VGHYASCYEAEANEEQAREIHEKAALGLQYQKAIAELRPADVYERIHEIHIHLMSIEESVIGRDAVMHLESAEHRFRDFYSGRDRKTNVA